MPTTGYTVYVIGVDTEGPVKIGVTKNNAATRLADLQMGSAEELHVLHTVSGVQRDVERKVHSALASARRRGEWFSVSLTEAIDAIELVLSAGKSWWIPQPLPEPPTREREALRSQAEVSLERLERLVRMARDVTPGKSSRALREASRQVYLLLREPEPGDQLLSRVAQLPAPETPGDE